MNKLKEMIKKINIKKITVEDFFCLYIILCPFLDILSFLYRQKFSTMVSPSTILRPIIPITLMLYTFIKKGKEKRKDLFVLGLVYGIYGIIHLYVCNMFRTNCAYGGTIRELQYIVNYSFMIFNLYMYVKILDKSKIDMLKKSAIITSAVYIVLMYLAIITGTSSATYEEGLGLKGWFESGNSISAILTLLLFILLPSLKNKKYRLVSAITIVLIGIYLTTLIGTRVGLFGFFLVAILYLCLETFFSLKNKNKVNKKFLGISAIILVVGIIGISVVGSNTLKRRKLVHDMENNKGEIVYHLTGDLSEIYNKIQNNTLEEGYMSDAQKKSIVDLYNYANKHNLKSTDLRMQQLVYNVALIKNQKNILTVLFGTGFMNNFNELIMEMEIPAFLLNFGILGFNLYFIPFLVIAIYGLYYFFKIFKKITIEFMMYLAGVWFAFALSLLSGYTFFNSSTMMVIIVLNVLMLNEVYKIKGLKK